MFIVTDGLLDTPEGLQLHPQLLGLRKQLRGRSQRWFEATCHTPLSLAAQLVGKSPATLIAEYLKLDTDVRQCWVASPFHARLMRDRLQVMPEGLLPWAEDDANALTDNLNPLLAEEGMQLHAVGAALLLACCEPIDAQPVSFAEVAGSVLPNSHPNGVGGGRLMRLVSEIQMHLHRHPLSARGQRGEPDVHGIWIWGRCDLPCDAAKALPPIATRNAFLASLANGRDARITLTDAEQLDTLLSSSNPFPDNILLMGSDRAVWLQTSWKRLLPNRWRGALKLTPSKVQAESALYRQLEEACAIA